MKSPRTPIKVTPGLYHNVPDVEYHQWAAWSKSAMFSGRTMREVHEYLQGKNEPSTGKQRLGDLVHQRVLESKLIDWDNVVVVTDVVMESTGKSRKLTTDAKPDTWAQADKDNPGKVVIADGWADQIDAMAEAFKTNREAVALLERATDREVSVVWEDEQTGLLMKSRLDGAASGLVVDAKSTSEADPDAWQRRIAIDFYYDVQCTMYLEAAKAAGYGECDFKFIVQHTSPPYAVVVHEPDDAFLKVGRARWRERVAKVALAFVNDEWVGDPEKIHLGVPYWLERQYEHNMAGGE